MRKRIALVGYGYWGPNLLRNLLDNPDCDVVYCCDKDASRLELVKRRYPTVKLTDNYNSVCQDPEVDAVVIATPINTHYLLVKKAIENGKDVLVEKPLASTFTQAVELQKLAAKNNRVVMVDHTFIFSDAVRLMKEVVEKGDIGKILYIDAVRVNLGLFQKDSNCIFDLAVHDLSIIQYLLGELKPVSIQTHASVHIGDQEDLANIYLEYPKNISAHIQVSWLSPVKIRKLIVVGTKKMIVYDDIEPTEKIKIYDKGVIVPKDDKELQQTKVGYRMGDLWCPKVNVIEPLAIVINEFIHALKSRKVILSDINFGKDLVALLEMSDKSVKLGRKINYHYANK